MAQICFKLFSTLLIIIPLALALNSNVIKVKLDVETNDQQIWTRSNTGIIKGVTPCGGSFKALQWRYESCLSTTEVCQVPTDGEVRAAQLDFIPTRNVRPLELGLRYIVRHKNGKVDTVTYENPINVEKELKAGNVYTTTIHCDVSEQLRGENAEVQLVLYNLKNEEVEVCVTSNYDFV